MAHQDWVVELTFATEQDPGDEAIIRLDELGEEHERYVSRRAGNPGVVVSSYVSGDNPAEIGSAVSSEVARWLVDNEVDGELVEVRVLPEEQRAEEAVAPTMPSLVSASGAAEILEVTRQRVHQLYRDHSQFPKPLARLVTGPVWDEKSIEWFNSTWERKPGRPAVAGRKARGAAVRTFGKNVASIGERQLRSALVKQPVAPSRIAAVGRSQSAKKPLRRGIEG